MSKTTKITMKQNSWNLKAGQQVEVPSDTAERLIADGHAFASSSSSSKKSGE